MPIEYDIVPWQLVEETTFHVEDGVAAVGGRVEIFWRGGWESVDIGSYQYY